MRYPQVELSSVVARLRKFRITRRVYQATSLVETQPELDALLLRNVHFTLGYYRRLVRIVDPVFRSRLQGTVAPCGVESVAVAERPGTGVVLLAVHMGDFDLAASWIAEVLGRTPVVPVAELGRPLAQRFFTRTREAAGLTVAPRGSASMEDLEAHLRLGRIVILTLDRVGGSSTIESELLGRPANLPAVGLTLARRAEAPILTAATWRRGTDRVLSFGCPETIEPTYDPSREREVVGRLGAELERAICAAPHEWHVPADLRQLSISIPEGELPML